MKDFYVNISVHLESNLEVLIMSKINPTLVPSWNPHEKFPYNYKAMKNLILPHLVTVFNDTNKKYNNVIKSICLLKNIITGKYIDIIHDSHLSSFALELGMELLQPNNCDIDTIIEFIYDEIEQIKIPGKFFYHIGLDISGIRHINASLSKRMGRSLIIGNHFSDRTIITFKAISEAENRDAMLNELVYQNVHYTWEQKKKCFQEEPTYREDIPKKEFQKYAGIVHLWAKQNYIDIPEWVYKPFYLADKPIINIPEYRTIPEEFLYHGLTYSESEFINV